MRSIDAHAAGASVRVIISGWPAPKGATMAARRDYARKRHDHLRRVTLFEPRGHDDLTGAILTEPERQDSAAGVLFMHNDGYPDISGHGIIAVATIALERGLISPRAGAGDERDVTFALDIPAGQIQVRARLAGDRGDASRVESVSFVNVPSFVFAAGVPVTLGPRVIHADIAFAGAFYAIVDAESAGLSMAGDRLPELRAAGARLRDVIASTIPIAHPADGTAADLDGVIFTGPPTKDADLRNITVFADRALDRSPCGAGTCAVLAVLDAMGLASAERPFVHEGILGTTFTARIVGRTMVGDIPAIVPELTGSAWITGEHTFIMDKSDPLSDGFRLEGAHARLHE